MDKRKYLAWIYSGSVNAELTTHFFLIKKLCAEFEKLYFININKLKFFSESIMQNRAHIAKVNKRFELPDNIEIFNPSTISDFKNFMVGKELVAINNFGRQFSEIKIHFLFSKYKIKQVKINNVGFYNAGSTPVNKSLWQNLKFKLNKNYSQKLIFLLSNLGLVPKIEIRFISNSEIIEMINKSFVKKILYKLKLFYTKELVLVNSSAFDINKKTKIEINEDKIVLIDYPLHHIEVVALHGLDKTKIEKHYYYLNNLINNLSNLYNKEVVVCIHPQEDMELSKRYFPNLNVVQFKTRENIYKAFMVLVFDSSSIIDAILLKKRIVSLVSNFSGENTIKHSLEYAKRAGTLKIDIEKEIKINKEQLLADLDKAKENYSQFIKTYLNPDGLNIGYEKIIKILKERFFN